MPGQPHTVAAPVSIWIQLPETSSQNCSAKPFQNSWPTKSVIDNKGLLLLQVIKFWGDVFYSTDNCNTLRLNSGVTASEKPTWLSESGLDAPLHDFVPPPASFTSRPYCTLLSSSTTSLPTKLQFLKAGAKSPFSLQSLPSSGPGQAGTQWDVRGGKGGHKVARAVVSYRSNLHLTAKELCDSGKGFNHFLSLKFLGYN